MSDATKRKRGRPKGPLNKKELAQRQSAAVKTGEHSRRLLGAALPPCKTAVCPEEAQGGQGYPCDVKKGVEARGGGLAVCLVHLGQADVAARFRDAIVEGRTERLAELRSLSLAAYQALEHGELEKLLAEGLTIDRPIVGFDEAGPKVLDHIVVANPRAENLIRVSKLLGNTADDQVITPKSRGEKAANDGVGQMGRAAWLAGLRRGLSGEEEG
jgi:hypothetical protein